MNNRIPRQSAGAGMMKRWSTLNLLLLGAAPRVVSATVVIALLWVLFLWATSTLGPL